MQLRAKMTVNISEKSSFWFVHFYVEFRIEPCLCYVHHSRVQTILCATLHSSIAHSIICTRLFRGKMHSEWFNGTELLQGRWQHGEKVGYCYPSWLEKTLCKWDIYVPLVTKELTEFAEYWYWKHNWIFWTWCGIFNTKVAGIDNKHCTYCKMFSLWNLSYTTHYCVLHLHDDWNKRDCMPCSGLGIA